MLTHYFELRLIPQPEIAEIVVRNQVMQQLHRLLVELNQQVALSFPCYHAQGFKTLGNIFRLMGSEAATRELRQMIELSEIANYAVITAVINIPAVNHYLQVSRVHYKGLSALRRAKKRLTEQQKWDEQVESAMTHKWLKQPLAYPYFQLQSQSTGQMFNLVVRQKPVSQSCDGEFNAYGLSQTATVPDF